ncbi:hypothetical protein B0T25DRAFT_610573, partial [Lasiosphaeria hispida]
SLAAIGSIGSLEQIWLSAGWQFGWRHQWLIDHNAVRSCLQRLAKLKRLAISRDTYQVLDGGLSLELGSLGVWERAHRNRMLRGGEKYAAAFPCLEWMYCGQWPMEIRKVGGSGGTIRAVPLGKERDSCRTLLH